ncbi:MAG: hypothetical protein LC733_04565 [Actinobacteria bacterium]|nr:hypothetical protein [Actinomycetota bacterium]
MFATGLIAGLITKLAGLGTAAKVAVATTTAALTMTVAGATAVVLPSEDATTAAAITEGVTEQVATTLSSAPSVASDAAAAQAGGEASVTTPAGSVSATAAASSAGEASAAFTPSLPSASLPIPGVSLPDLPDLSGLAQIPAQVMSCLAPIMDLVTGLPAVDPARISGIGTAIVGCVSEIVEGLPLPFGLNACISEILGFVSSLTGQLPTAIPDVGGLDVASCIPSGLPVPTGFPGDLPFMGDGFPFNMMGGFPFGG